jgi:hypothetical protein
LLAVIGVRKTFPHGLDHFRPVQRALPKINLKIVAQLGSDRITVLSWVADGVLHLGVAAMRPRTGIKRDGIKGEKRWT